MKVSIFFMNCYLFLLLVLCIAFICILKCVCVVYLLPGHHDAEEVVLHIWHLMLLSHPWSMLFIYSIPYKCYFNLYIQCCWLSVLDPSSVDLPEVPSNIFHVKIIFLGNFSLLKSNVWGPVVSVQILKSSEALCFINLGYINKINTSLFQAPRNLYRRAIKM